MKILPLILALCIAGYAWGEEVFYTSDLDIVNPIIIEGERPVELPKPPVYNLDDAIFIYKGHEMNTHQLIDVVLHDNRGLVLEEIKKEIIKALRRIGIKIGDE